MHKLLIIIFILYTHTVFSQPSQTQLALSERLASLLQVHTMFSDYLKQCSEYQGSSFNPKVDFMVNPSSFGGISPQSAYWPEVESLYGRFRAKVCAYATSENVEKFYAEQLAKRLTEEELSIAITFYTSSAGQRIQGAVVSVNDSFQKFANDLMNKGYEVAREQFQIDLQLLIQEYKKEPR